MNTLRVLFSRPLLQTKGFIWSLRWRGWCHQLHVQFIWYPGNRGVSGTYNAFKEDLSP